MPSGRQSGIRPPYSSSWSRAFRSCSDPTTPPSRTADDPRAAIRIGIDYRPALYGRGGIAVYVREIVQALAALRPDDSLALYGRQLRRRRRTPYGGDLTAAPNVRLLGGRFPSRALPWLARMGLAVDRLSGGLDVFHLTDYTVLPAGRAAVVVTIHDVLFDELPGCYTPSMRAGLQATTRRLVDVAARIIVPSARTQRALSARYGVEPARIDLIPHGPRALPVGGPRVVEGRYVFFVGTLEPRKNVLALIRAFDTVRAAHPGLKLVLAGSRGWMDDAVVEAIARRAHVIWLGAVGPERLGGLYAFADVVAYPSLGEGFGLPVLEAMARGKPLLVGAETACADLAGDAALAVEARDEAALAEGLRRLLEDEALRGAQREAGPRRARRYTWEAAAAATYRCYERAAEAAVGEAAGA